MMEKSKLVIVLFLTNLFMPGWRSTKYKKKYAKEMLEFFQLRAKEYKTSYVKRQSSWHVDSEEIAYFPADFPTFEKFSLMIKVFDKTLSDRATICDKDWKLKYPEFSASYNACKAIQKDLLLVNWLSWMYNNSFANFVARNYRKDEFKEKKELDHGWQKDNPIQQNITFDKAFDEMSDDEQEDSLLMLTQ